MSEQDDSIKIAFSRVESIVGHESPGRKTKKVGRFLARLIDETVDTDPMTKLPTYERFNHELLQAILARRELSKNKATPAPDTVVYCDLNHFKPFNKLFQEHHTNRLIKSIADVLQHTIRSEEAERAGDFLARSKKFGDEFLIFMPGITEEDANARMKGIVEEISQKTFLLKVPDGKTSRYFKIHHITMAHGCHELDANWRLRKREKYDTPHSAIDKADQCMRANKEEMQYAKSEKVTLTLDKEESDRRGKKVLVKRREMVADTWPEIEEIDRATYRRLSKDGNIVVPEIEEKALKR